MNKSILVIDTPTNCRSCIARTLADDCGVLYKSVAEHRYNGSKPDWCPLKKIPEKQKEYINSTRFFDGWNRGYNDCITEILK